MRPHRYLRLVLLALATFGLSFAAHAQSMTFSLLAGSTGGPGPDDGPAESARLDLPDGVAMDPAGNILISESGGQTLRRLDTRSLVTTVAGLYRTYGLVDGSGGAARFARPSGIAFGPDGRLYMADAGSYTIRRLNSDGSISTFAGKSLTSGSTDGSLTAARFNWPMDIAFAPDGTLYVANSWGHTVRRISTSGLVTTVAGKPGQSGYRDDSGLKAEFNNPQGLAVGPDGAVVIADTMNHVVRRLDKNGVVTTLAGRGGERGAADGPAAEARFNVPADVAVASTGVVYVADWLNHTIRVISTDGIVTTLAGAPGVYGWRDGPGSEALFYNPSNLSFDAAGNLLVTDRGNHAVRRVTPSGKVTTIVGRPQESGSRDANGAEARFWFPGTLCTDRDGSVLVPEGNSHVIRRVTPAGVASTWAGRAGSPGSVDGVGAEARFQQPIAVAVDAAGNAYVADYVDHTIRKVSPSGNVTTVAGRSGEPGTADGQGTAARFRSPAGIAVTPEGVVYVADYENYTIRRVGPDGVVSTLAGKPGTKGTTDGQGQAALFQGPVGLAVDRSGVVFVSDYLGNTIRTVTPNGQVTTVAGSAAFGGADGRGTAATFGRPAGLAVDAQGFIWVADQYNHVLRRISPAFDVVTVAGKTGVAGAGDGTGLGARFNGPFGVAFDAAGLLYVANAWNHSITVGRPGLGDAAAIDSAFGRIGETRQLDTDPKTATAWRWEIVRRPTASAALLSSTSIRNPTFVPDRAEPYVFRLTASAGNTSSVTEVTMQAGSAPGASVSGGGVRCDATRIRVAAALSGTAPWTLRWSDGLEQTGIVQSPVERWVGPEATASYSVTSVSNDFGSAAGSGAALVTVLSKRPRPIVRGPSEAPQGAVALSASASATSGSTYRWEIANGTITAGQGSPTVTFSVGPAGTATLSVVESNPASCDSDPGFAVVRVTPVSDRVSFGFAFEPGGTGAGSEDGIGPAARFNRPVGVAVGAGGAIYLCDSSNGTIRQVEPNGRVSTLSGLVGGYGSAEGRGASVSWSGPTAILAGGSGGLWVGDRDTVRRIASTGDVSVVAGKPGECTHRDGLASEARFCGVTAFALLPSGDLVVVDSWNHVLRRIKTTGEVLTIAGKAGVSGSTDGVGTNALFREPQGVALDDQGVLYVSDTGNRTIRRVGADGSVTTVAGTAGTSGSADGIGASARFTYPTAVVFHPARGVLVGDHSAIRGLGPDGRVTTLAGLRALFRPYSVVSRLGVAVDDSGNVVVADEWGYTVSRIEDGSRVVTLAGRTLEPGDIPGPGGSGTIACPTSVATTPAGSAWITDECGRTVRRVSPRGELELEVGMYGSSGAVDGHGSEARFAGPAAVALDSRGNAYVADGGNHTIRMVTPDGTVSTLAGKAGTPGSADGSAAAARFSGPYGIAVDRNGVIFVADRSNHTIRRIDRTGSVSTLAGVAGAPGARDGVGPGAAFRNPRGLAVDGDGNVLVADTNNSLVRRIDSQGVVTTVAGQAGYSGSIDGPPGVGYLNNPRALAVTASGEVLVAEGSGIRRIDRDRTIGTVAGPCYGNTSGTERFACFGSLTGVAVRPSGELLVTDFWNATLRTGSAALLDWSSSAEHADLQREE